MHLCSWCGRCGGIWSRQCRGADGWPWPAPAGAGAPPPRASDLSKKQSQGEVITQQTNKQKRGNFMTTNRLVLQQCGIQFAEEEINKKNNNKLWKRKKNGRFGEIKKL
jgi:hypothetical protein